MRNLILITVFAVMLASCRSESVPSPQALPKREIELAGRKLQVEIADTPLARHVGMMHRKQIGPDEGMLFVFPSDGERSFYMRNTLVPLSIAFISAGGAILNIEEMKSRTETTHLSAGPCRYALEMPARWFEKHGVKPGDKVGIPADVKAED